MRTGTQSGRWLLGVLIGLHVLGSGGAASSEDRFRGGATELTLAGGYSVSHDQRGRLDSVDGVHLIPHFGYVLTDERGPGWVRGNFELLAEPTLIHLEGGDSTTVGGLSTLGRWVFAGSSLVRPYVEAGVGILGGQVNLRQTNCDVNFLIEGGPGVLFFVSKDTAVTVGYRFQHISNADRCSKNQGLKLKPVHPGPELLLPVRRLLRRDPIQGPPGDQAIPLSPWPGWLVEGGCRRRAQVRSGRARHGSRPRRRPPAPGAGEASQPDAETCFRTHG
jgi:lipid A 3-O-deacylase